MLKKCIFIAAFISGSAWAADANNDITLNFSGKVIKPSCLIQFDTGTTKAISFNNVNVSDVRYFDNKDADQNNNINNEWTYQKYISSPPFNIQISGCSPEQLAADSQGNQLSLTIAPASGEWVITTSDGAMAGYMDGAIAPTSGPTGVAAKFLIAHPDGDGNILRDPPSWDIFSRAGITVRYQSGRTAPGDNETAHGSDDIGDPVSNFRVSLAKLPSDDIGGVTTWLIPMKVKLGMKSINAPDASGAFSVSASITATYY